MRYHAHAYVIITSVRSFGRLTGTPDGARKMIRTQVQLTEEQARTLKILAVERESSVAELIRQSVDIFIRSTAGVTMETRRQRAIAAAGRFRSDKSDVSTDHDEYLAEAYHL
jgi:hypothetical protein